MATSSRGVTWLYHQMAMAPADSSSMALGAKESS